MLAGETRPVGAGERVLTLDVLRGVALLGILLVNMALFSGPALWDVPGAERFPGLANRAAGLFVAFFASAKFITMFSLLFGIGVALQLGRFGGEKRRIFVRRMVVLLGFGILHGVFLWMGDILAPYAVTGLFLLLFYRLPERALLVTALTLWGGLVVFLTFSLGVAVLVPGPAAEAQRHVQEHALIYGTYAQRSLEAYSTGSFMEITRQRASEYLHSLQANILALPLFLAMMLLGLYLVKQGMITDLGARLPLVRRVMAFSLPVGLVGNGLIVYARLAMLTAEPERYAALELASTLGHVVGGPAFCLLYAGAITLLCQRAPRLLTPLAAVGRMAITNYLMQSLLAGFIFYAYGLGLYGRVSPAAALFITLLIFGCQLLYSPLWLKRFRYGPVEWLWRTLSYGRRQPMRRDRPLPAPGEQAEKQTV